ncbi:ABC-2 type transport system permease protein [Enterococcus rotai]|uniref:ABC transporter permease n=1 Tax=Enterococcus rotai TaxID=118060 RepID=A0A0U2VPP0_9ENTE|nr:ABC transporter permease [Enterococcus rotai]ALS36399.1 ABC transporter permease [Enterococcus rotai]
MSNMLTIALETYKQKVESKVFIIMLLVIFFGTFFGMNYEAVFKKSTNKENVIVVSKDQQIIPMLQNVGSESDVNFIKSGNTLGEAKKEMKHVDSKTILTIDKNNVGLYQGKIYYQGVAVYGISEQLQKLVTFLNQEIKVEKLNLDEKQKQFLKERDVLPLESLDRDSSSFNQTVYLVYIVGLILYIAVMLYSTMVAQDIAVEKSSRVMEILLTTITPVQHLVGKIVGIGLLGLTQGAVLGISAYASYKVFRDSSGIFKFLSEGKNNQAVILAIICFILGYLIYSVSAAILGSLVSSVQEVQQLMYILIIPLFIALFMVVIMMTGDENNQVIVISSYLPFLSPIIMYARYILGDVTMVAFVIAMLINVGFTVILALLGKSVYQGGVFMYNGDKSINTLKKAFKSGKHYS